MPTIAADFVHEHRAQLRGLAYLFTQKHHGADRRASQWLPALSFDEEFGVFNLADARDISDADLSLYGIARDGDGLRTLGKWYQQVAYFPVANENQPRHGYPLYPLNDEASGNRGGEKHRPPKLIFDKLLEAGLITATEQRRLKKGDPA